ncbi:MAG: hypothetical protein A4E28_01599 [Methanocella sp. PtaU1.Bin125]|nr:MAG: hypothetical protein A4E28_01599 [Methanocella sp. PtaU1.Bin125]
MAASACSIIGSISAMRPRTPEGTSMAAYFSPFLGSSGVMFMGGESRLALVTFFRTSDMSASGSWPKRSTRSASIRLLGG